jgi:hypothetical protein
MNFKIWLNESNYTQKDVKRLAKKASIDISKYKMQELVDGINTETEHAKIKKLDVVGKHEERILKIALAHLEEDPKYYTKLKKAKL